jgi:predicted Zn-dependent protease
MSVTWTLEPAAVHRLRAAEGWLELGNHIEANEELEQIRPQLRVHPEVLVLRWHICARSKKWDACIMIAKALIDDLPDDPRGWIALAQTFCWQGKVRKAFNVLRNKALEFIDSWPLLYDASRYAFLIDQLEDAENFFCLALAAGNPKEIRRRAQADPDLVGFSLSGSPKENRSRSRRM